MNMHLNKLIEKYKPKKRRHSPAVILFHWLLAPSFLASLYSGLYISHPNSIPYMNMERARRYHLWSGTVFLAGLAGRIYYAATTDNYKDIIPTQKDLSKLPEYLGHELFLTSREPKSPKYNPLQKIAFASWTPIFIIQGILGLTLSAPGVLSNIEASAGGLNNVRRYHYLIAIALGNTVMGHIYFTVTSGKDKIKSIFTGYMPVGKK